LTVAVVEPPAGADAIRIGPGPELDDRPWQPLTDPAPIVEVEHAGYQLVFGQYRLTQGGTSTIEVAGVDIDPTVEAATSGATPSWIRPLSPTDLVVRVEAGRLERGAVEPYDLDNPVAGDSVGLQDGRRVVRRNGQVIGVEVSQRTDVMRRVDRLIGTPLDGEALAAGPWTVTALESITDLESGAGSDSVTALDSGSDPATVTARLVTRPGGSGVDHRGQTIQEVTYDVVLSLRSPLQPGAIYLVSPPPPLTEQVFVFNPTVGRSPAVRVNQAGYHPGDPKVAVLSGWFDGMGAPLAQLGPNPAFSVIDANSDEVLFAGTGQARAVTDELGQGDLTGSAVTELDFTALTVPGRYRVCVEGLGCSHDFTIDADVWGDLAVTVARAMYHQRSGVELAPPYASFVRPRPYHPDDGATVTASGYTLLQARTETDNTDFDALVAADTGQLVDQAWGGHFDAGDWDRRIQHLYYARAVARLLDAYPDRLGSDALHLPESGNGVPDLLDEAMWTVDLYTRMQLEDGAIRGGIEASGHPPRHTSSWTDDLAVFAYGPDRFASYLYAGVGAEVSMVLRRHDQGRADELLASALAAMEWAEAQAGSGVAAAGEADLVEPQRAVAAAALLAATGDRAWHEVFVNASDLLDSSSDPYLSCHEHERCDAAWLYLAADPAVTDQSVRDDLRNRFVASADAIVAAADSTAYGWTTENPFVPLVWGLGAGGAPHTTGLFLAHQLTGDARYRQAAVRSASVSLGLNPLNTSFVTGVGDEPVRHPLIVDVQHGGLPVWPGTPVYGPHRLNLLADDSWVIDLVLEPAGAEPSPTDLPYLWQFYDVDDAAMFTEFTVHQSHAEALTAFAWLSATG
jgi:endoglucanase